MTPTHTCLTEIDIDSIVNSHAVDPFTILGIHKENNGLSIRVFYPSATQISVRRIDIVHETPMQRINEAGFYIAFFPDAVDYFDYELVITDTIGTVTTITDPYSFLPVMSEASRYLFNEGNHQKLYEDLGSHIKNINGVSGVVFAVWAPNAKRVSVVGQWNNWDGRYHQMRLLGMSGIWELFIPGLGLGVVYKYEIKKHDQNHLVLKTDPCGYKQEPFPYHGTIVCDLDSFSWSDQAWINQRQQQEMLNRPLSIYELHLGSWRKSGPDEEGDYLSYRDIAHQLVEYVQQTGFTHVELLPVQEHPYVPSWGYQVGGFYAVNHRFGSPEDFQYFVNYLHSHNIGVIIDWVAGHFPKDSYGLAHFDGTHLYEYMDSREGEHKEWGTLIFNFNRHEVRNFLSANALYWLDKYHIDGLRVDAVASMLYRNYSRKDGEWISNKHGGVENLEAISLLQSINYLVHEKFYGVVTLAEESTAWPLVSRPTYNGGLGFSFKWNMGWMHDMLYYMSRDPIYRKHHQDQLTFGLWYAFSENFVLVLSHDEVVHGKRSILEKMPGDMWQKFANVRALYGYMFGHPGKKLLFQGGEFGMHNEWYEKRSVDWHVLTECDCAYHHQGLLRLVSDLNKLYVSHPCLWENDFSVEGFSWIDFEDRDNSIISFLRQGRQWDSFLLFVCNFTPIVRYNYKIGVPYNGIYREIFNTDSPIYGGAGYNNGDAVKAGIETWQSRPYCLTITLPPLSVLVFQRDVTNQGE